MDPTNTMSLDAALRAAQVASQQNDRYLFVALLFITGIAIAIVAKWLANQYNRMLDQWRQDMKTMQESVATLHVERVKASERYSEELRQIVQQVASDARVVADRYAAAMTENAKSLGQITHALGEMQHYCAVMRAQLPASLRPFNPQTSQTPGG